MSQHQHAFKPNIFLQVQFEPEDEMFILLRKPGAFSSG